MVHFPSTECRETERDELRRTHCQFSQGTSYKQFTPELRKKRKEQCLDKLATTSHTGKGGTYFPNYRCQVDLTSYYLSLKSSTLPHRGGSSIQHPININSVISPGRRPITSLTYSLLNFISSPAPNPQVVTSLRMRNSARTSLVYALPQGRELKTQR